MEMSPPLAAQSALMPTATILALLVTSQQVRRICLSLQSSTAAEAAFRHRFVVAGFFQNATEYLGADLVRDAREAQRSSGGVISPAVRLGIP